ncbi:ATP-binding protein [Streptomyces varsoviensis]|uniref:ATP-binding protein n=1 Tax=Streptomyces varsoviensis TaxID=67373 RepID=UPI0033C2C98F
MPVCRPTGPPPQLVLAGTPESVPAARAHAREFVGFHVPEAGREHLDDVLLVVSELVTNAVRYGTEPGDSLLVVLDAGPGRVRIEVHDTRRRKPRRRPESAARQRGHGLFIVDALAEWGVGERPMGKIVWAVVRW